MVLFSSADLTEPSTPSILACSVTVPGCIPLGTESSLPSGHPFRGRTPLTEGKVFFLRELELKLNSCRCRCHTLEPCLALVLLAPACHLFLGYFLPEPDRSSNLLAKACDILYHLPPCSPPSALPLTYYAPKLLASVSSNTQSTVPRWDLCTCRSLCQDAPFVSFLLKDLSSLSLTQKGPPCHPR